MYSLYRPKRKSFNHLYQWHFDASRPPLQFQTNQVNVFVWLSISLLIYSWLFIIVKYSINDFFYCFFLIVEYSIYCNNVGKLKDFLALVSNFLLLYTDQSKEFLTVYASGICMWTDLLPNNIKSGKYICILKNCIICFFLLFSLVKYFINDI